jgi:nucleotide-binding universal stress UspA family protein
MFSKLLLPLDGSPEAAAAVPAARTLARATGAAVRLVRVVPEDQAERFAPAAAELDAVARELGASGVETTANVRLGPPDDGIVAEAEQTGADLIVMATHGRSGLGRAILGSVADGVVSHGPVPLLLLRPGGHRLSRLGTLLVPLDGSPGGALALGVALGLARSTGARVVLLEVAVPLVSYALGSGAVDGFAYMDPAWDEEARAAARSYVTGMAERLRRAGVAAEARLADAGVGGPSLVVAEAIGETADDVGADMIVMSTHALTGPARTLLGSVADAVVRGARRPVLLIRRGMRLPGAVARDVAAAAPDAPRPEAPA